MPNKQIMTVIRGTIRERMASEDLSLRGVARSAKIDHKTLTAFLETTDNPGIVTVQNVLRAVGVDLADVIDVRREFNAREFEAALVAVLPGMPRGSVEKRARYLAETVSDVLALPPIRSTTKSSGRSVGTADKEEDAPPL